MSKRRKKKENEYEEADDERYFLNPDSVSCHLFCSICHDVFSDPQRMPCGHSYCRKCILPWLKQNRTCPEDRKPVTVNQLHHDFILENIIGDQMVACPYRKTGCDFIGQLQNLSNHKKRCDFNPVNLPKFILETESPSDGPSACLSTCNVLSPIDGSLPSPGKPSLMMRLFRAGGENKELLRSMFENKENTQHS